MIRIAVITATFGNFDSLKPFPKQDGYFHYDFIQINENRMPFPFTALDNRMKAKYFKIQPHKIYPDYDYYIWLDGAFQIKSPRFIEMMLAEIAYHNIAVTKHPDRNCIYDEAKFVLDGLAKGSKYFHSRYATSQIEKEISHYAATEWPILNGLYACGLFIRRNDEATNKFFDAWWDMCLRFSVFDQLSFPVLARALDMNVRPLVFSNYLDNEFYKIVKHGH